MMNMIQMLPKRVILKQEDSENCLMDGGRTMTIQNTRLALIVS